MEMEKGSKKMRTRDFVSHYRYMEGRSYGQASAEVYGSMAIRAKDYGVIPLCAGCRRSCKLHGGKDVVVDWCADWREKK
jgi:hypothetical protein